MISKSLWHVDKYNSEIREIRSLKPNGNSITEVSTQYSMISTGTELTVATGNVCDEFSAVMGVPYMKGDFSLPIKYGYACSGKDSENNLFHFMHPHQNRCFINDSDLFKIDFDLGQKVPLISNMETVINAIWDADLNRHDRIAIMGYGNIGSLLAETLSIDRELKPVIIERNQWRRKKAESFGYECYENLEADYDVIYNTTASGEAMNSALSYLKEEGKLVELSWYANSEVKLELGKDFHYKRLKIISSQVSKIPIKKRDEIDYKQRKIIAINYLKDDRYNKLITHIIDFDDAPIFFKDLRNRNISNGLIYLFKY